MTHLRRALLALALIAGFGPAFAQAPGPVPALPDTERRTSYSISASTCACAVNFALYGDSTDYQNWVEVWVNGVLVPQSGNWTITSPSGAIANLPRPITNAVLTFTAAQTGTVQIVGARRPRRTSQFSESRGVAARDLNVAFSDIIAQNREIWDKTSDFTGRGLFSQPGVTLGGLPLPSVCENGSLGFDATGLLPVCRSINTTGIVTLPVTIGHLPIFNSTTGLISDSGISPLGTSVRDPGTGTLEALLPVQTVTGASKVFAAADLFKKTRRSNAGSAMTDTLPGSTATGLINGTRISIANADATASDTVTAGSGTTIAGASSFVIGPSRDITWVYDLANTAWRADANTATALIGTSTTVVGTIPYFSNTSGNALSGAPVFQSGNPGNAALYNALANPANGYTTVYNGMQISLGTFIPAIRQFGANAIGVQQAIVGTLDIAADPSSTRPVQGNGVAGYARTNVADGLTGAVGIFGQASMSLAGGAIFGANAIDQNCDLVVTGCGLNFGFGAAAEFDHNIWAKSGPTDPTAGSGNSHGIWVTGGGDIVGPLGHGVTVHFAGIINSAKWVDAFWSRPGAAVSAFTAGPAEVGNSQGSQPITFQRTDGSGNILTAATIKGDVSGNLLLDPGVASAVVALRDGTSNSLLAASASYGGSNIRISGLAVAGVVTNTSAGLLGTLAGTTTTVLHGNASGLPTFAAVDLTADVTGSLPGVNGGTGQSAYVMGDTLYSPSANILFRLPGNTTTAKQYLSQTGTGTLSAAPAWATIAGADITGAAITKTDDTNVTLTLGGTPATAALRATSFALGWTGTLANSRLATMATNTVKGNATSGTASPTDLAVGSCSTAGSALIWTTNTGFGCNTSINAGTLGGATFAAPGAIGGGTPGTGAFTTVSASTSVTSPLGYGGSSAGSTLTINGTSNGSPSSAFLNLQSNGQKVGIGNTSPKAPLDLNANLSSSPALAVSTSLLRLQAADNTAGGMEWTSYGTGAQNILSGVVAGGTAASPTATADLTNMFNMRGYGYNGTSFQVGALMVLKSVGLWSGSNQGSQIDFYTTTFATTSLTQAASINPKGGISIGSASVDVGAGTLYLTPQTFATLPAASSTNKGAMASVSDSTTVVWGATITGSGANPVLAFSNGTNWTVAGK